MTTQNVRRPIRWRIAETMESSKGWKIILGIGTVVLLLFVGNFLFKPFVGRPEDREINQTEVRCGGAVAEIAEGMPATASPNNARRVCVQGARARVFVASIGGFFIALFTALGLLINQGRIQPKEPAR